MRREKFVFNQRTLQYDRVVEPLSYTLLRIFGFVCAACLTAVLMLLVVHRYFPSPSERLLMQENDVLRGEIDALRADFDQLSLVLGNVQERDAYAHRMVFGMEPIDPSIWNGGRGGHDAYADLRALPRTGEEIADLHEQVDRFRHQLDLQSRSLDSITLMAEAKEDMLASIPSIKPIRKDKFNRKLENLSGYGYRIHPVHKISKMHWGVDFNCRKGTKIQATGKGKVVTAGVHAGYGNCVIIDHGYGYRSLYAHMSEINVKRGQTVDRGEVLGLVGSTGLSTGDHLHYEVMKDGQKVDPIQYCHDGLTPEEYEQMVVASRQSNQSFD